MKTEKTIMQKIAEHATELSEKDLRKAEVLCKLVLCKLVRQEAWDRLDQLANGKAWGKIKRNNQKIRINGQLFHVGGAILGGIDPSVERQDPRRDAATFAAKPGKLYFIKTKTGGLDVARYTESEEYHSTRAYPSLIPLNTIEWVMEPPE